MAGTDDASDDETTTRTTTSATSTTTNKTLKRSSSSSTSEPVAKKAKSKCKTCRSETCAKGQRCPHYKEYGKPESPPDAALVVEEGGGVAVFDLEFDEKKGDVVVNEVGACVRRFSSGNWTIGEEDFKEVTKVKLGKWGLENCMGLNEERKGSKQGFREVHEKFVEFIKINKVSYLLAHGVVSSDARVMVKAGHEIGIDVIRDWKEAGIKGVVDTMRVIPQYDIKGLRHLDGKHVLSNGVLFTKATKGATMREKGLQEHRALDDSKATAEWVTGLPEVSEVMFGLPRRPTAISIDALGGYYAQIRKHKSFLLSGVVA